jgi:transcriptional regulator with XRE-family HTH domain
MYSVRQANQDSVEVQRLRQECGNWLRSLREQVGLSQRSLALAVGLDYYSFVSQIETGKGRIPTHQIKEWATALKVPPRDFARKLLSYYDPTNYELLFGDDEGAVAARESEQSLQDRVSRLEAVLKDLSPRR